ncbi:MAG: gluconate 2-dehydrogenase subunit 3 family protein [Candidatus Sulfobium sp.]|jgi:hypothetical protein
MAISRRSFLRLTLGTGLLFSSGYILKDVFMPAQLGAGERRTLGAYLDTLIPQDQTPGAVQLGVPEKIFHAASEDAQYRRLVRKGCRWLDLRARRMGRDGFTSLGEREREEVAEESAGAPAGSVPRIFFERTRAYAFFHYYAHPASWEGLGYKGPPQPDGYPDYTKPQSLLS